MSTTAQGHPPTQTSTNLPPNPAPPFSSQPSSQLQAAGSVVQPGVTDRSDKSASSMDTSVFPTHPEGLLPAFSASQYSHLPTPHSPNNIGRYVPDHPYTPESPVPQGNGAYQASAPASLGQRLAAQRRIVEETPTRTPSASQQCMTPESSPFVQRITPHYNNPATPQYTHIQQPHEYTTPRATSSSVKLESPILTPTPTLAPAPLISSPVSVASDQPSHSSRLSSPFMAKLNLVDRNAKGKANTRPRPQSHSPVPARPMQVEDMFSTTPSASAPPALVHISTISTPPISPPHPSTGLPLAGGELQRIRQTMAEEQLAYSREAESRRPDYLKRAKRTLAEADPSTLEEDDAARDRDRGATVGIMESPHKGRRLKLFQETSEESFEESLMAGGYGRYRTADWVRQPQPLALPPGGLAGPSNVVNILEEVKEAPPTEKELRKRKRLAAFSSENSSGRGSNAKLFPVELEGKGRVLIDMPNEEQTVPDTPEPSPSKKRAASRRKKKAEAVGGKKGSGSGLGGSDEFVEKPNWPDAEFPWRLRTEERAEFVKAEEEEKMKWIERFLDRDSDEEDDNDSGKKSRTDDGDEEVLPSAKWGMIYEDEADKPLPPRMGRGKMVPLLAHPEDSRRMYAKKRSVFPSDPADARAALLSKKSVRALSYRQQRRQRELREDDSEDEVLCICNGKDDGRELVQCDRCQTWYHLQCIGIRNISELGREEDPWFCQNCVERSRSRSPSSEQEEEEVAPVVYREPTFVPTDEDNQVRRSYDAPFFQPSVQDSPVWNPARLPKTPTRDRNAVDPRFSSSSSWINSSGHGPSTPQNHSQGVRVYTTPGPFDNYDEAPFDPTSTPSRGLRIGPAFTTPKNNVWATRAPGPFHTPSKQSVRGGVKTFGGAGSLSAALDDSGSTTMSGAYPAYDESPVRRNKPADAPKTYRMLRSPPSRSLGAAHSSSLEESPIVRTDRESVQARGPTGEES
ncbi:hypothetical protein BDQ12DRAFT_683067 [Crucibulum laeve]|uniref:PHD-type domain-containing protein n=1 Tax=Crucibulum laeve TaxID=68775 RepID=A0A5C3M355_9AGAR|nr:hypothetical protein BDQ12DRAFT_683067 [Crucibulum laeve]